VNKKVKPPAAFTLKFAQKRAKQKPDKFEDGPITQLEEVGFESTDKLLFGEPIEVEV
jgi:hypothetical protein